MIVERHPKGKAVRQSPESNTGRSTLGCSGGHSTKTANPWPTPCVKIHYVEDRFHVPVAMQQALANALKEAGSDRVRLADDLARLLVSHAFLGELDVNPVVSVNGSKCDLEQCEFWARRVEGPTTILCGSVSKASPKARGVQGGDEHGYDGRLWQHEVKLTWEGIIEMKKDRMSRLLLVAAVPKNSSGGTFLGNCRGKLGVILSWAGRAPDLNCGVRYGIMGEPVPDEETGDAQAAAQEIPDEARKQLVEAIGGGHFLVLRDKVQEELKLLTTRSKN